MKIGWIGLGSLGYPVAVALALKGHDVMGYDINPAVMSLAPRPYREVGPDGTGDLNAYLPTCGLRFAASLEDIIAHAEILFLCIQTPHQAQLDGSHITEDLDPQDFNYQYLIQAIHDINAVVTRPTPVVIISTVLPGTIVREILPIASSHLKIVYSPFTPAMGTVLPDFYHAEFYLIGRNDPDAEHLVKQVYRSINANAIFHTMSITSAEFTKVFYNTWITTKISLAQYAMEICTKIPDMDVDVIMNCLKDATKRLVSPRYMTAGMHDGGQCFLPGTLFYTDQGMKPIEDIRVGDYILGYDGKLAPITRLWKRHYQGDIQKIQPLGLPSTSVTAQHTIPAYSDERPQHWSTVCNTYRRTQSRQPVSSHQPWIEYEAQDIRPGDHYLSFPYIQQESQIEPPAYASDSLALFYGYFAAEGSYIKNRKKERVGLQFAFHADEESYRKDVRACSFLLDETASCRESRQRNTVISQIVTSKKLAQWCFQDIGEYAHCKRVPSWILYGPLEYGRAFLEGLWKGDGHTGRHGFSCNVTSKDLAFGVQVLLNRFRIPSSVRYISSHKRPNDGILRKESWEVRVRNATYLEQLSTLLRMENHHQMQKKRYTIFPENNHGYLHRIRKNTTETYEGIVYNLTIDNDKHYLLTTSGSMSNCHPRDLIALSALEAQLHVSTPLFTTLIMFREEHTRWLAYEWIKANTADLPYTLLGYAFKTQSTITQGSAALLLEEVMTKEYGQVVQRYDPYCDVVCSPWFTHTPQCFFIGCNHPEFLLWPFPERSIIVDPFRLFVQEQQSLIRFHQQHILYLPLGRDMFHT